MALTFLNPSRNYDAARQRVHFTGHDGMFEISFSVEVSALPNSGTSSPAGEPDYLAAFDRMRDSIHGAARKSYSSNRKSLHILTARDLC